MPSPEHQAYRNQLLFWFRSHAREPGVAEQLDRYRNAAAALWELDLEPARAVVQGCYAPSPRGGDPWDPIVVLRCLLLMVLVVQTSINKWAWDLAGSLVLRVLAGLPEDEGRPGVGTFYDFLARLHDGPVRKTCEHQERPSEAERAGRARQGPSRRRTRNPNRSLPMAGSGRRSGARGRPRMPCSRRPSLRRPPRGSSPNCGQPARWPIPTICWSGSARSCER